MQKFVALVLEWFTKILFYPVAMFLVFVPAAIFNLDEEKAYELAEAYLQPWQQ